MQATKGDNDTERPMWAEKGGLDFEGRARWDAWTAVKGTSHAKAMLQFVKVRVYCKAVPNVENCHCCLELLMCLGDAMHVSSNLTRCGCLSMTSVHVLIVVGGCCIWMRPS